MTAPPTTPAAEAGTKLFAGPRGIAVKILNRVGRSDAYLDRLLDHELRSDDINELDKGLMNEIVTGVIRWQMKLDWVLTGFFHGNFTKAETNIRNALRVALYQILFLDRVPHSAAVNEAVEFIKRLRGQKAGDLVNAVLRNIIRNLENIRYPDPKEDRIRHLSVVESHPYWMTRRWVERFGYDDARRLMAANNRVPDLCLRINRLKTDIKAFHALLEQHQISFGVSRYLECFIRVPHMADIGSSDMFRRGYFSVQDESAGLAVRLLDPQPGHRVLDLCAAPGGKTTFMGELMNNTGEIVAVDRYETRLNLVKTAAQRTGVTIVELLPGDASEVDLAPGDRVLVDVPCSGLGVLAKKPDAKWHREVEDIERLSATQEALLRNAARLVLHGGVIVYSTCTIEPEENRKVIEVFLREHPDFTLEAAGQFLPADVVGPDGFVETYPHTHGMDGSFAARLRRTKTS